MKTRKIQYGWMALGGLVCLSAVAATFHLNDGSQASAPEEPEAPASECVAPPDPEPTPTTEEKSETPPVPGTPLPPLPDAPEEVPAPEPAAMPPVSAIRTVADLDPEEVPAPEPAAMPSPPPPPGPVVSPPPAIPAPTGPTAEPPMAEPEGGMPPAQATHNGQGTTVAPEEPAAGLSPVVPVEGTGPVPARMAPVPSGVTPADLMTVPTEPPALGGEFLPTYRVRRDGETLKQVAHQVLGSGERCAEVQKLNPGLNPEDPLAAGCVVRLPNDARVEAAEPVKPLPSMRPARPKGRPRAVLPLTGTYVCELDKDQVLTLPRALRDQLDGTTVLVSPGPDKCLWLTDQAHLERLNQRLEESSAPEADVRVFKRLYFAQIEKMPINEGGRVVITGRLARFAGLGQKVVLVGIGNHYEVWDEARWRRYTREKSGDRED
jgi:division/cell wall cluster transcriptional repressor MraZ